MLILRAILLWSVISIHVIGAVALFRRLFPRESVWLGFIIPPLAFVSLLNFIEHLVALPTLVALLPITTIGSLWSLLWLRGRWRHFKLPVNLFLLAFAGALILRALRPDITMKRDGPIDLCLIASFCMGQKLPPPLLLYPPVPLSHYYAFGHYGASVLTRLFDLDIGTGFNLSVALIGALACVLAAGIAWHVSGQRIWVTILSAILTECGGTGISAYLALTIVHLNPNDAGAGLSEGSDQSPIWTWLKDAPWFDRPELFAPGVSNWIGAYHSNTCGQLLILLMGLSLVALLRHRRSNWPWICLGAVPFFTVVTSSWALVFEGPILLVSLFWIWKEKFYPRDIRFVGLGLGLLVILLLPDVWEFHDTTAYPGGHWTSPESRTPFLIFAALWWPVYLPWIALLFVWPRLSPAVKTLAMVLPVFLFALDFYTVGMRLDWIGKIWGYVYLLAWSIFLPRICIERAHVFRILLALLIFSGAVSLASWVGHAIRRINWTTGEILHLEGTAQIRLDPSRGPILAALSRIKGQTILPGKSGWLSLPAPVLAAFTGNYVYVSWSYFDDVLAGGKTHQGATLREHEVNNLYDGKIENPLSYLRTNNIAALVIYPDDNIPDSIVARLKTQLAPLYDYQDTSDGKIESGVFIYRPLLPVGKDSP